MTIEQMRYLLYQKESEDLQKEAPNLDPEIPKELLQQIEDLDVPEQSTQDERSNQKESENLPLNPFLLYRIK